MCPVGRTESCFPDKFQSFSDLCASHDFKAEKNVH